MKRIKRKKNVRDAMGIISSLLIRIKNLFGVETAVADLEKEKPIIKKEEEMSHKKIEEEASKALKRDGLKYKKKQKIDVKHHDKKNLKKHKIEEKEAMSASKDLKKRAKKAHE